MSVRAYRAGDAAAVASLSAECARSQNDFVMNPMWETEEEFLAEFLRHGIRPEEHLIVDDADGEIRGLSGYLRWREEPALGALLCPIVGRTDRGRGLGGELLRSAMDLGRDLGIEIASAGIGTRNRSGYSLLLAHGFRPVRQNFLMRCDQASAAVATPEATAIALAGKDDADDLARLYDRCGFEPRTPERWTEVFGDGRHMHGLARQEGEAHGFVEVETHWKRRNWLSFVGVDPETRDQGLGAALVAWALRQRFEAGAETALLILSPSNRTAVRAYEKVGFRLNRTVDVLEKAL